MLRKHWQVCALFTLACSTACSGGDEGSGDGLGSGGTPTSTGGSESTTGGSATTTGGNPSSTGGALGSGGAATGGVSTGGNATGGNATGGMNPSSGGNNAGGSSAGGSASGSNAGGLNASGMNTGGASTGGKGQGGASTGGKGQGGTSTGGKSTGGASTGGKSQGGASTGGSAGSGTGGAATGGSAGGSACPEVDTQLCGMVAQHNAARAGVMPVPATPLPEMTWNTAAAAAAQSWADQCMFSHNTAGYGQNIYASAGSGAPTPKAVVDSWVSEAKDYNYAANTCSGVCGHYTQVVWRGSIGVGCAVKACSVNSPFSGFPNWYIVVCNYSPAGNVNNQKPY